MTETLSDAQKIDVLSRTVRLIAITCNLVPDLETPKTAMGKIKEVSNVALATIGCPLKEYKDDGKRIIPAAGPVVPPPPPPDINPTKED